MQILADTSDDALLRELDAIVRSHRGVTAELVLHLGEVDARRLHLERGFPSLFSYCVERLAFSEDEACRRIEAARLARRFPAIHPLLSAGELSLTVLGLLKPHLTDENHAALLAGVVGSSVRQAKEWLASRFPRPDVPSSIRKRPCRIVEEPSRSGVEPLSGDRFLVKFTATRVVKEKLELARDLMRHGNPSGELGLVVERALDLLILDLQKAKLGRTNRPLENPRPARDHHVTRAVRREVVERDGWRCSFVSDDGRRCCARAFLEFDHEVPKGRGGNSRARTFGCCVEATT